jgi:putative tricarboxylic transport membrane protein
VRVVLDTWKELPRYWLTSMRSSAVGCFMGIVPGGATPASFMSYGVARRFSKDGDKFGTGMVEGVVAPETAAHAAGTSALLPMITLGVPGSPTAAVLLGGPDDLGPAARAAAVRRAEGLRLGPDRLDVPRQHRRPDRGAHLRAAVRRHPARAVLGDRADHRRDLRHRLVHGAERDLRRLDDGGVRRASGYSFKKLQYPLAPLVLAIVLGDNAEASFRQAMLMSQGDMSIFFANKLVGFLTTLAPGAAFLAARHLDPRQGARQIARSRSQPVARPACGAYTIFLRSISTCGC